MNVGTYLTKKFGIIINQNESVKNLENVHGPYFNRQLQVDYSICRNSHHTSARVSKVKTNTRVSGSSKSFILSLSNFQARVSAYPSSVSSTNLYILTFEVFSMFTLKEMAHTSCVKSNGPSI